MTTPLTAAFPPPGAELTRRRAVDADAERIHRLSSLFVVDGALRERSAAAIADAVKEFTVVDADGDLIGCVGMRRPPDDAGSQVLYNFCVHPAHQRRGIGRVLLDQVLTDAAADGAARVYTATTGAGAWFERFGFVPTTPDAAPRSWVDALDPRRSSRVYVQPLRELGAAP
ncbi:GNAT family N-acetyltransferase [Stackebrandtia soli]|uniref:GNAT family N-acetyltransferase n=1 Tax=Stackebrandtia soli TaxID=1892856 RepID=UPI0039EB9D6D